ncbi:MAG: MinD/ParA family protein [Anaerolineales bacterium]|nr:MinD/ParA family protein [Anaerolineales bacterium]
MTQIISTHSFRGGTGKSNITANLAALLARRGHRVGVFDTDIQSPGIHVIFNLAEDEIRLTLNDYLWGNCSIEEATYQVQSENGGAVFLVPSSIKANDIARVLREKYDANDMHDAFRSLISAFRLDYLLIDTHPGLNEETLLSIAISDKLIIVLRPDRQDFQGTSVTVDVARRLRVPHISLVINKIPPEFNFADVQRQVEETYDCDVAALLALSTDLAENASSSLFCLEHPDHPFTAGVEQIVALCEMEGVVPAGLNGQAAD